MKAIMYHYVRPSDPAMPYFRHLPLAAFKKQVSHFATEYGICSKAAFLESLETGMPTPGVVLTFDDGFRDHYQHVLPYLLEQGWWGIFYIPTRPYLTHKLLDVHRVHVLLGKHGGRVIYDALQDMVFEDMLSHAHIREFRTLTYINQNNDHCTNIVKRILNYYISYEYREKVIDDLMERFIPDEGSLAGLFYMRPEEIRRLQAAGMVVGSHTVNHPVMSKLPRHRQEEEIRESFRFLDCVTGGLTVRTFCHPYGGFHSFTDETERLLQDHGCLFSVNVEPRDIDGCDLKNRPQALPRYDCNQFPFGTVHESKDVDVKASSSAEEFSF